MKDSSSSDDSRSSIVISSDLNEEDIANFKSLALTVAAGESSSYCLFEVNEGEFEVKRLSRNLSLDPLFGGGSVLALILTMSFAVEFTPIALVLLVMSFLMPDTSRLLAQAIQRKFKKPIILNSAKVSVHSPEKSLLVKKAQQFGFVTTYMLMPDNTLRVVLQLPEDTSTIFEMLG